MTGFLKKNLGLGAILLLVLLASGWLVWQALGALRQVRSFSNPIAYTIIRDHIFVMEKDQNTLLALQFEAWDQPLKQTHSYKIEGDDGDHYFMVRHLYPGPRGLVVHSYLYEKEKNAFVGYRFREFSAFGKPPRDLLTVYIKNPETYPELRYTFDAAGRHYFVNNCEGSHNLWRVRAEGGVVIRNEEPTPGLEFLGESNTTLSSWTDIKLDTNGTIYVTSGAGDQVVFYTPEGERAGAFGHRGFAPGELLSPEEMSFDLPCTNYPHSLVVASTGNRTWVRFSPEGQVLGAITPLQNGYPFPDILVDKIFPLPAAGGCVCFDMVNRVLLSPQVPDRVINTYRRFNGPQFWWSLAGLAACWLPVVFFRRLRHFWRRRRVPFFIKLLLLVMPLLAFSTYNAGGWVRDLMLRDLNNEYLRRSANLARAILNSISMEDLFRIQDPSDRGGPEYERIYNTVSRIMDIKNVEFTPKWIIHKIRDGRYYFGINIWRGSLYEPYIIPRDRGIFIEVLREKHIAHGRYMDEQGEWFSYLTPILNENGEVAYVIELYRPTESMDRVESNVTQRVYRAIEITLLAALALSLPFSWRFTRPVRQLRRVTETLSRGDFSSRVRVHSHDEVGALARDFNRMVGNLKHYTQELARSTAEKERYETEMRFAREVQQGILPRHFPPFARAEQVEIHARLEAAYEVAGDFYDFFLVDEHHLGVVVADISGKGPSAGLFMMLTRTLLRDNALGNLDVADTLMRLNRLLAPENPATLFATMFYFICDLRNGRVQYCSAAHLPPLLLRDGRVQPIELIHGHGLGTVVGVVEDEQFTSAELALNPGDRLLLYTDGLTEPIDKAGKMYGDDRLYAMAAQYAGAPDKELCDAIFNDVMRHQSGLDRFDDMTLLCFRYLAPSGK